MTTPTHPTAADVLRQARQALDDAQQANYDNPPWFPDATVQSALAAIDAEAKPVVRMLTAVEFEECCGGCKVTSAAMTWMRRSVSKFAEVNGLTIGEQG